MNPAQASSKDTTEVPARERLAMLEEMVRIRHFECRVKQLYRGGEIPGAIHLYIGQEAVAVGACRCLREDDYVTSTHRGHGHAIAKGLDVRRVMAELMGREDGYCRGRGGSMHLFDATRGFLGGNGIVGGGIGIALGAAFAAKYQETSRVCVCFFSDGASNQGVLHESLNMAALWRLPVVYVCENNQYAATTPVAKSTATPDIAPRAGGYGLPWSIADGNDVLDVHSKVNEAVVRAREGQGASFVECKTYRVEPHCGIIADQRDAGEIHDWRSAPKDPILRTFEQLAAEGLMGDGELREMERKVDEELEQAVAYARQSPHPKPESLPDGLWAE